MNNNLEARPNASVDSDAIRLEKEVARVKAQTENTDRQAVAHVFDKFWQDMLKVADGEKLNVSLQTKENDGNMSIRTIEPMQIRALDRTNQLWKGTVIDSGTNDAFVIVTKANQNGKKEKTEIRVSPFEYKTENGDTEYKLKPDSITTDNPTRGAMFRNKTAIS